MNYLQKLFVNSVSDFCTDIMKVRLSDQKCFYIFANGGQINELPMPFLWDEAKKTLFGVMHPEDREMAEEKWKENINENTKEGDSFVITYRSSEMTNGNEYLWWSIHVSILDEDGELVAFLFSRDYTNEMKERFTLRSRAEKDALTFLYNNLKLEEMIKTEYRDMKACGVLYFSINNMTNINEKYGKEEGDNLLKLAAESIRSLQNQNVLAYRVSGDEFIAIACNYSKDEVRQLINFWIERWNSLKANAKDEYEMAVGTAWDRAPVSVRELISKANAQMFRNKKLMKDGIPLDYYVHGEVSSSYGLHTRKQFFETVDYKIENEQGEFCLIAFDIEHFKLYNKWYGRNAGDEFLAAIAVALKKYEDEHGGVSAYFGGDNFAMLLPYQEVLLDILEQDIRQISLEQSGTVGFLPAMGIFPIKNHKYQAIEMYDFAVEALSYVKGNFEKRSCVYDESMTSRAEEELRILSDMKEALEKHQFTFFAQPKCRLEDGRIVGAEALVRWIHPEKGVISPGVFVPVLEKNGFISGLDRYIWEQVCKQLSKWKKEGIDPVPFSINISRIDILSMNVVEYLLELVRKYDIKKRYLKIEITESAYAENANKVLETIEELRREGFTLLMDDFGSGYSSLNMLRNAIVDIIKIDMKFLDIDNDNQKKGLGILRSVINMTNELELPIIVEGVETEAQVRFLRDLGVRYGQGYYYYKPMPIEEFGDLLRDEMKVDHRGIYNRKIETTHIDALEDELLLEQKEQFQNVETKRARGGFMHYEANESQRIYALSNSLVEMFGCKSKQEFLEYVDYSFSNVVHPEDRKRVEKELVEQISDSKSLIDHVEYRIIRKDGEIRYIDDYGLLEEPGTPNAHFQVFLLDVTEQMQK